MTKHGVGSIETPDALRMMGTVVAVAFLVVLQLRNELDTTDDNWGRDGYWAVVVAIAVLAMQAQALYSLHGTHAETKREVKLIDDALDALGTKFKTEFI